MSNIDKSVPFYYSLNGDTEEDEVSSILFPFFTFNTNTIFYTSTILFHFNLFYWSHNKNEKSLLSG